LFHIAENLIYSHHGQDAWGLTPQYDRILSREQKSLNPIEVQEKEVMGDTYYVQMQPNTCKHLGKFR